MFAILGKEGIPLFPMDVRREVKNQEWQIENNGR
jgi:hypothetical protein